MNGFTPLALDYDSPYGEIERARTIISANVKVNVGGVFEYNNFKIQTLVGGALEDVTKAIADYYPSKYHLWFEKQLMERTQAYAPPGYEDFVSIVS